MYVPTYIRAYICSYKQTHTYVRIYIHTYYIRIYACIWAPPAMMNDKYVCTYVWYVHTYTHIKYIKKYVALCYIRSEKYARYFYLPDGVVSHRILLSCVASGKCISGLMLHRQRAIGRCIVMTHDLFFQPFLTNSLSQCCQNFQIVNLVYSLTLWNLFSHHDAVVSKKWLAWL